MSARPSDIPESVWEAAVVIAGTVLRNLPDDYGDVSVEVAYIARVMLAAEKRGEERERERCALIADAQYRNLHNDAGRHLAGRIAHAIRQVPTTNEGERDG